MHLRSNRLIAAALGAGSLSLAACGSILGLGDFEEEEPSASSSGASTGGGSTTTSAGPGGAGGSGGTGGSAPTFACDPAGAAFDVFSEADLTGITLHSEALAVVGDQVTGHVHVAISAVSEKQILVRSFKNTNEISQTVRWPDVPSGTQEPRVVGGFARAGNITFWGALPGGPGHVVFAHSGEVQPMPAPVAELYPAPAECPVSSNVNGLGVIYDGANVRFGASCEVNGMSRTMYGGRANAGAPDFALTGAFEDDSLRLGGYAYVAGQHLVIGGADSPSPLSVAYFRYGADSGALGTIHQLQIDPAKTTFPISLTTTPAADAVVMFAATFDFPTNGGLFPADLWAARLGAADFGDLEPNPGAHFQANYTALSASDFGVPSPPAWALGSLVSAGSTLLDDARSRVLLNWWTADATPRVIAALVDEKLDPPNQGRHTVAAAAPGNLGRTAVVWIAESPASAFSVQARLMDCHVVTP